MEHKSEYLRLTQAASLYFRILKIERANHLDMHNHGNFEAWSHKITVFLSDTVAALFNCSLPLQT